MEEKRTGMRVTELVEKYYYQEEVHVLILVWEIREKIFLLYTIIQWAS